MQILKILTVPALCAVAALAQTPTPAAPAAKKTATTPAATAPAKPAATAPAKPAAAAPAKPATAAAKPAADPNNPVVMTVGDQKITQKEYEALVNALPEQVRAQASTNKKAFAERVAELKSLAYEARRRKLDQSPTFALQIDNALANELVRSAAESSKADPAAIQAYYDAHKAEYEQVTARHILIRFKGSPAPAREGQKDLTKEEALAKVKELRAKIVAGGDFAEIAKAESDDTGSGANGGSLGAFGHGQMVPPFEQAAFALPIGQISEPVESQFGYHLIKVESHDSKKLDEVKPAIENTLKQDASRKAVDDVKKAVPVTFNETYFGK